MSVEALVDVVRAIDKRELLNLSDDDMQEIAWAVAAKAYHIMADAMESDTPVDAKAEMFPVPPIETLRIAAKTLDGTA